MHVLEKMANFCTVQWLIYDVSLYELTRMMNITDSDAVVQSRIGSPDDWRTGPRGEEGEGWRDGCQAGLGGVRIDGMVDTASETIASGRWKLSLLDQLMFSQDVRGPARGW